MIARDALDHVVLEFQDTLELQELELLKFERLGNSPIPPHANKAVFPLQHVYSDLSLDVVSSPHC